MENEENKQKQKIEKNSKENVVNKNDKSKNNDLTSSLKTYIDSTISLFSKGYLSSSSDSDELKSIKVNKKNELKTKNKDDKSKKVKLIETKENKDIKESENKKNKEIKENEVKDKKVSYLKSMFNHVKNVIETVQDNVQKIEETFGDQLLQDTRIKNEDKRKEVKLKEDSVKKPKSVKIQETKSKREKSKMTTGLKKNVITWKINQNLCKEMETRRKKLMQSCLEIGDYSFIKQPNYQISSTSRTKSKNESKLLFNNILDQLTDYELSEILKNLPLFYKIFYRFISKRFRTVLNQLIQNETTFALIEKNVKCNFDLKLITSFDVDPIYIEKSEDKIDFINEFYEQMNNLNAFVLAYSVNIETYFELIRKHQLNNLVLIGKDFTDIHMNALPDYTLNLTTLNLDQCNVTDLGLNVVVRECGKVLSLRLFSCEKIVGSFLEYLPSNFICLEIINCVHFKKENWKHLVAKGHKQMNTLAIENTSFTSLIFDNLNKFDKLINLRLKITKHGDYNLKNISLLTRLEYLKIVDYSNPPCFVDSVFIEIQRGCDRLSKIDLQFANNSIIYLTDESFINLVVNCQRITSINLTNLLNLNEITFENLSKFKNLFELSLINMPFENQTFINYLKNFSNINRLTLNKNERINSFLIDFLFKLMGTKKSWCHLIVHNNPKIKLNEIDLKNKPNNLNFDFLE